MRTLLRLLAFSAAASAAELSDRKFDRATPRPRMNRSPASCSACKGNRTRLLPWLAMTLAAPTIAGPADEWQPISPQDLSMTAEPKAPGAGAIILYRQVDRNDQLGFESDYVRVKILDDSGRDRNSNVRLQYFGEAQAIEDIRARTIHADGSVYPFDGSVPDEPDGSESGQARRVKIVSLPKVDVGSIVEYRWRLRFTHAVGFYYSRVYNSQWVLNDNLFTREARFSLRFPGGFVIHCTWPAGLPAGTQPPVQGKDNFSLVTRDVPAFVSEEFMPPADMARMRVDFHYSVEKKPISDPGAFWTHYSRTAARYVDEYVGYTGAMEKALATVVDPHDSDETKLRKIYARVQQLHNDSYEPPAISLSPAGTFTMPNKDVADVWNHQHGEKWQITLLFLGMARAAGFQADPVMLSARDRSLLNKSLLEAGQLNSSVMRVKLGNRDIYADPGAAFNPFGALPWYETAVEGLRVTEAGGDWVDIPSLPASASGVARRAKLQLSSDGTLRGSVTVRYSGVEAQLARLKERAEDAAARTKYLEGELQEAIPVVSEVKLTNSPDWSRDDDDLVAEYTLKIDGWAQSAGQRSLLTTGLFSSHEKGMFTHDTRVQPIYFWFPYRHTDEVDIALPADLSVGTLPEPKYTEFKASHFTFNAERSNDGVHLFRNLTNDLLLLPPSLYPQLRDFYQSIRAGDTEQIVLTRTSTAREK
jgi:hypothetical protein